MNGKHLFLTSAGLTDKMKEKFFDIIGKCPKDVKVLGNPEMAALLTSLAKSIKG